MEAELRVHALDMTKLAGVCEVLAVPCEEEVTLVVGSECEVGCVSNRVFRHDVFQDVHLHDIGNGRLERKKGQVFHQGKYAAARRVVAATQFLDYRPTGRRGSW